MNYLIVFIGGGIGTAARYGMNVGVARLAGTGFPLHTLLINITGCFIMGLLTGLMALRLNVSNEMRLFLTTGILGGYTTFSAFALDFALLVERRDMAGATAYLLGSVLLSLAACLAGLWLVRVLSA